MRHLILGLSLALASLQAVADPDPLDSGKDRTEEARTLLNEGLEAFRSGDDARTRAFAGAKTADDFIMLWDLMTHEDGTRGVATFGGEAEFLPEAEFQKRLADQRRAAVPGLRDAIESIDSWGTDNPKKPSREKRLIALKQLLKECEVGR